MKFKKNPARVTQGMDESDDPDELIEALVDNVVADPENVHSVSATEVAGATAYDFEIEVTFNNKVGQICAVDGILEKMNMRDWHVFCDKFLVKALDATGHDAELYNWPIPHPEVTKVPEDGGTDVIARVCVTFKVDARTYSNILLIVDKEDEDEDDDAPATGEEICAHCDAVIRYAIEAGKHAVVCPECGTINPLCNECDPDSKRCSECKISQMCEELNKQRADALPKPEED